MAGNSLFRKLVSAVFVASLLGTLVTNAGAAEPRFNFLPGDTEFLTGRNTSEGQTDLVDPVSATAGQEVEGVIYYHNGEENTVARNTRVQVTLPDVESATHALSARLSADNATAITDTVVNGQIVGKSGLTITTSTPSQLEFVPGSVRWFPDNATSPMALPNGQTGTELFTTQGLNIGDITGCWSHAGYIMFKVRVKVDQQPQVEIVKDAHLGAGHTPFGNMWNDSVNAGVGDEVHFRVTITNPGSGVIDQVRFEDNLPGGLEFVEGSASVYTNDNPGGAVLSGDVGAGVDLGVLHPADAAGDVTKKLTVLFTAKVQGNFSCGENVLTNSASVTGAGLRATDTAKVVVTITGGACEALPQIEKHKRAFNVTKNGNATSIQAVAGDIITYTLSIENTGNATQNAFVIEDGIRDILDYADVQSISDGGVRVDQPNDPNRDNQVLVRYPAVNVGAGQKIERTFTVTVKNPLPTNPQNGNAFDFTLFNQYGDKVIIEVARPAVSHVIIEKLVRNVTKSEGTFADKNTASPGDTLEYRIQVKNTGNKTVPATLKDILPNGVVLTSGSLTVQVNGAAKSLSGDIFGDGMVLPALTQGIDVVTTFKVSSSDKLADSTNLVNNAIVSFEGQQKEDSASTVIVAPVQPVVVTPTPKAPSPVQASLPSAGANPFAYVLFLSGALYTWISRRRLDTQFKNLSTYVEIV